MSADVEAPVTSPFPVPSGQLLLSQCFLDHSGSCNRTTAARKASDVPHKLVTGVAPSGGAGDGADKTHTHMESSVHTSALAGTQKEHPKDLVKIGFRF